MLVLWQSWFCPVQGTCIGNTDPGLVCVMQKLLWSSRALLMRSARGNETLWAGWCINDFRVNIAYCGMDWIEALLKVSRDGGFWKLVMAKLFLSCCLFCDSSLGCCAWWFPSHRSFCSLYMAVWEQRCKHRPVVLKNSLFYFSGELVWASTMMKILHLSLLSIRLGSVWGSILCLSLSGFHKTPRAEMSLYLLCNIFWHTKQSVHNVWHSRCSTSISAVKVQNILSGRRLYVKRIFSELKDVKMLLCDAAALSSAV